jgi:hypothetical protein
MNYGLFSDAHLYFLKQRFVPIWMAAMQEEMGNAYSNDVRDVWKKALSAFTDYASTP